MTLTYNGRDISGSIAITQAIVTDTAGRSCDTLELEFEDAASWDRWRPATDDTIKLTEGNYDTGDLYVNTVSPEEGKYRILATALPSYARNKRSAGYKNMTLGSLTESCALECGMLKKLYGIADAYQYRYLTRDHENMTAFLQRICDLEGAVLKIWNGKIVVIGVEKAQGLNAKQTYTVNTDAVGVIYERREDLKLKTVKIVTPYATADAVDNAANGKRTLIRCDLPAMDNRTAKRWARAMLMMHNRQAERLTIPSIFNAGWTAMERIDITGGTEADGRWVIDTVTHDLFNKTSEAQLLRVIDTVV